MRGDEIDDLLGESASDNEAPDLRIDAINEVTRGVSIPWLMGSFRMSRIKVIRLLTEGGAKPLGKKHNNGGFYYDLVTAAECLVTPKQDFKAFLKTLKPSDLPSNMHEAYWAAKLKEQKFRAQAGELWSTSAVMQVFGDTFKMMKSKVQLWPDTIAESVGLDDKQREVLHHLMVDLLNEMAKELTDDAELNETRSQLAELDEDENSSA